MSKTPRTDEHLRMKEENGHTVIVSSEFARQLERELADALAVIERKDKLIEQLKLALKTLRKYPHTYRMTRSSIVVDKDIEQCKSALEAAERGDDEPR